MHFLPTLALAIALSGHQTTNPPTNVLTWADSNPTGTVTWSMQRGSNGCAASSASFATIATGLKVLTYTDGNLNPGTVYSYQVLAVRTADGAVSGPSNCVTVTLPPPAAPTGLTVTSH